MKGYRPLDTIHMDPAKIQAVDCGTYPITLACAINQGGNGAAFACCRAIGFDTIDDDGKPLLLIIDCTRHHLERTKVDDLHVCPLCDGGIITDVFLRLTDPCVWVPTVYAKVSIETRLDVWRRALPAAQGFVQAIEARKKAP